MTVIEHFKIPYHNLEIIRIKKPTIGQLSDPLIYLYRDFRRNGTEEYHLRNLKIIPKPGKASYLSIGAKRPIFLINMSLLSITDSF